MKITILEPLAVKEDQLKILLKNLLTAVTS